MLMQTMLLRASHTAIPTKMIDRNKTQNFVEEWMLETASDRYNLNQQFS